MPHFKAVTVSRKSDFVAMAFQEGEAGGSAA
jgi:hypothetical protein